jgi:hypothetical protein
MAKDQLEIDRDAAIAAAKEVYNGARAVAEAVLDAAYDSNDADHKAALKASQAKLTAEQKVISATIKPRGRTDAGYADAYNAAHEKAGKAWKARNLAIDEKYKADQKAAEAACRAACDAAYVAYLGACDEAEREFDRLWDERQAAEDAAEDARIAAEDRRQRREEAKRAQAARLAEEERALTAGPAVTVTPYQAAARLGLTMKEFWAHVISGKYPEPRDDNTYDRDTIDRLPRPKVVRRKPITTTPSNIFTDIVKF